MDDILKHDIHSSILASKGDSHPMYLYVGAWRKVNPCRGIGLDPEFAEICVEQGASSKCQPMSLYTKSRSL